MTFAERGRCSTLSRDHRSLVGRFHHFGSRIWWLADDAGRAVAFEHAVWRLRVFCRCLVTTPAPLAAALAGRYDLDREIGEGGMATVYLARDVRHGRSVAVKMLKPELGAVLGAERFLTEIQVTAQLQHERGRLPESLSRWSVGRIQGPSGRGTDKEVRRMLLRSTQLTSSSASVVPQRSRTHPS